MLKNNNILFKSIGKRKGKRIGNRCISKRKRKDYIASICDQQYEEEASEVKFSLSTSVSSCCHGVQPLGNLYFSSSSHNSRDSGLGNLKSLTDELFIEILGLLGPVDLGILSTVSKSLYVFTNHEPLWRNLVLDEFSGCFSYNRSWKFTYLCSSNSSLISSIPHEGPTIRDFYSDYLFQSWLCANLEIKAEWLERDSIERRRRISIEEFVSDFEELNIPVLLEGCLDDWEALEKWDRDYLINVCGDVGFSVGPVEMKIGDYFRYSDQAREERPLYLFDPKFAEKVESLGTNYDVPEYFKEDLFGILGCERPDYRWIIIGPAGSGSSFHIDPNSTSAWNAVIRGSKKWVLFPPDVTPPGVHPSPDGAEVACPVSIIEWFMNFYEATKTWKKKPVECVCREGEVVFVPNGWWHLVINLEESVAITQNYVSRRNMTNVLEFLKRPNAADLVSGTRDRVCLHEKFRRCMEVSHPGLVDRLLLKSEEIKNNERKAASFWESLTVAGSIPEPFKFSF